MPKSLNAGHDHLSSLVSCSTAGLTRNCLKTGCIDQPSPLVWAVCGLSNAGHLGSCRGSGETASPP